MRRAVPGFGVAFFVVMTQHYLDELTYELNSAAIEVHKTLGPGLLESIYQKCLGKELELRGIQFNAELCIPLHYKGLTLNSSLRCDFLVENCVLIETKSVEVVHAVYDAQLLTYMQQLQVPKGILYNFNCDNIMRNGQMTLVNRLFSALPVG
jgi:GxxExxY protein